MKVQSIGARLCAGADGSLVLTAYALAAGVTFLCSCKEQVTKRNTPQAARPFGVRNRAGIFGRHIHVPAENDAHPVRRPCGVLPVPLAAPRRGPEDQKPMPKPQQLHEQRQKCRCLAFRSCSRCCPSLFGVPFKARWRRWVQPLGAPRTTRGVFGRYMDVPSENSRRRHVPRRGALPGVAFFWLLFLATQEK